MVQNHDFLDAAPRGGAGASPLYAFELFTEKKQVGGIPKRPNTGGPGLRGPTDNER
jgi:hypothetical protein